MLSCQISIKGLLQRASLSIFRKSLQSFRVSMWSIVYRIPNCQKEPSLRCLFGGSSDQSPRTQKEPLQVFCNTAIESATIDKEVATLKQVHTKDQQADRLISFIRFCQFGSAPFDWCSYCWGEKSGKPVEVGSWNLAGFLPSTVFFVLSFFLRGPHFSLEFLKLLSELQILTHFAGVGPNWLYGWKITAIGSHFPLDHDLRQVQALQAIFLQIDKAHTREVSFQVVPATVS